MDLFGINRRVERKIQAMLKQEEIQAMRIEGGKSSLDITSLIEGVSSASQISGITNEYTTYDSQVSELYRKYNGEAEWGCAQTRALIDIRSAFLAGEGLSVSCSDPKTADWIDAYLKKNKLNGINFLRAVKGAELTGQCLFKNVRKVDDKGKAYIEARRVPYCKDYPLNYMPELPKGTLAFEDLKLYIKKDTKEKEIFNAANSVYIPIGGDDLLSKGPTPKLGMILSDLENYDRALKDMRRNNHVMARITPTFEVKTEREATALVAWLRNLKWKIGKAFIGSAKLEYKTPGNGAHENLKTELVATLKTISAVSGMPVHWLGYVDLMSNRSTADSLFEFINNATLFERRIWESSMYDLILMAQEMFIDAGGGKELPKVNPDFEIKVPLIDYTSFLERVRALSMAFGDGIISEDDYRSAIPGIDPTQTKRELEKQEKENFKKMKSEFNNPDFINKPSEGEPNGSGKNNDSGRVGSQNPGT